MFAWAHTRQRMENRQHEGNSLCDVRRLYLAMTTIITRTHGAIAATFVVSCQHRVSQTKSATCDDKRHTETSTRQLRTSAQHQTGAILAAGLANVRERKVRVLSTHLTVAATIVRRAARSSTDSTQPHNNSESQPRRLLARLSQLFTPLAHLPCSTDPWHHRNNTDQPCNHCQTRRLAHKPPANSTVRTNPSIKRSNDKTPPTGG
jgi:hypothetical protein